MTVEEMFAERRRLMEGAAWAAQQEAAAQAAAAADDDAANAAAVEEAAADAAADAGNAAADASAPRGLDALPVTAEASAPVIGDARHKYVGTDSRGDVYQLYDPNGDRVLEWAVAVNADSRDMIAGTLQDLGTPSFATTAQRMDPPPTTVAASTSPTAAPATSSPAGVPGSVLVLNYQTANDAPSATSSAAATATTTTAQPTTATAAEVQNAAPEMIAYEETENAGNPVQGDPAHKYVGQDARGQVWQTFDAAQNRVLEWAVAPGDDSRNIIGGTLRDLGAPSSMTIAQAPAGSTLNAPTSTAIPTTTNRDTSAPAQATTLPTSAPAAAVSRIVGDARHKYVGTDNRGDVYQLYDPAGDRVLEWAVAVNDDSRNVISGSLRDLGAPSSMTTAQRSDYTAQTTNNSNPSNAPGNATPGAVQTNQNTQTTAGAGQPRQSDARHKYVGRLPGGNDVWQLFDGVNVIEWQVKGGDESGNIISGTARNLGAPSSMTVAQNDGTKPGGPQSTTSQTISSSANQGAAGSSAAATAPGEKSAVLVWAGIAASLLSALK